MKIAAIIVTYNRLELLKKCVEALRQQTMKVDEIIVVNNNSTDGTLVWLCKQKDLTVITQQNTGSAGGQHTGIKTAYEKGHDWFWCMDDDGRPDTNCLAKMIDVANYDNSKIIAPLVLAIENPNNLAFNIPIQSKDGKYFEICTVQELKKYDIKKYINGWASFFNGILLPENAVNKIGLPKKEMFIWGDEVEYFLRIKANHIEITTLTDAIYYHPYNRIRFARKIWGVNIYPENVNWKSFCYFRNSFYVAKKYGKFYGMKYLFTHTLYFLFLKPLDYKSLFNTFIAFYHGLFEKFQFKDT